MKTNYNSLVLLWSKMPEIQNFILALEQTKTDKVQGSFDTFKNWVQSLPPLYIWVSVYLVSVYLVLNIFYQSGWG